MNRALAALAVLALSAATLKAADAPSSDAAAPAAAAPAAAKAPKTPKAPKAPKASSEGFKTDNDRAVYAWGYKVGDNLKGVSFTDSELKAFLQGVRDGDTGKTPAVSIDVYLPKVAELQQARVGATRAAEEAKAAEAAAPNRKTGADFAEKFSKEDGVKPINGGGFYKSLTEGKGDKPSAEDTVKVNYRGTLIDGSEFDASDKHGGAATFPLNRVIPCWTNGVAMMKVGGKAKLVCPSTVAYGNRSQPGIPGGSTLIFEVELLEIQKADAPKKN